jgi:hypothetical protein
MRQIGTLLGVVASLAIVTGCPKKKGGAGDAAAEASASDSAAASGPEAANADQVARFPDEAAIDHQAGTLEWAKTNVRKTPPSGEVIATLAKGTTVTQIASHDKYLLVTFEDPKNSGQHLMGWVVKDVFSAQPVVHPKHACPTGQTLLFADTTFCAKVCKVDTDCAGGYACTGSAQIVHGDGGVGDTVKNCAAVARPDAGTPPSTVDAGGTPTTTDAGAPKAADAGGGGGGGPIIVDPKDGNNCPPSYRFVDYDKKCHRVCEKNEDCGGPGVKCTRGKYCKTGP